MFLGLSVIVNCRDSDSIEESLYGFFGGSEEELTGTNIGNWYNKTEFKHLNESKFLTKGYDIKRVDTGSVST